VELVEHSVADLFTADRVTDHDRHDMAGIVAVLNVRGIEAAAQQSDLRVQLAAFGGAVLQVRTAARAAAATAGGNAEVKMKPEVKLRTKSQSAAEPAI
jgi:hypothetical protein